MPLTGKQKNYLRGLAHPKQPTVTVGSAGASPALIKELDSALSHHELLKIKLPAIDRAQRQQLLEQLCRESGAEVVQLVGRVGVMYRAADTPVIVLPDS